MKTRLRCVVVDDELHAIQLFKSVLTLFDNNLEVVGEAQQLPMAVSLINELKPDVVFMDIEMPNYSGLQISDFFAGKKDFELVYITAHQNYAIEAMRKEAFDYLLKPIEVEDLKQCVSRLNNKKEKIESKLQLIDKPEKNKEKKIISLQSKKGIEYVDVATILYMEASSMYCIFHTVDKEYIVSKPLSEFEFLTKQSFFRVHRSFILNIDFLKRISYEQGQEAELTNGVRIPIARSRKEDFLEFINKTHGS